MAESALIVTVAAAEPLVADLRLQHDPSARLGVPAHVTVLYPFAPPEQIDDTVLARLAAAIAGERTFAFRIGGVRVFPDTVWLAPEPPDALRALTRRIAMVFPQYQPYGGRFADIVPHLTVGHAVGAARDALAAQVAERLRQHGEFAVRCSSIDLIENASGRWLPRHSFALTDTADP